MIRLSACLFVCVVTAFFAPAPVQAQPSPAERLSEFDETAPETFALLDAIGAYTLLTILSEESIEGAADAPESITGGDGRAWQRLVAARFTPERLVAGFERAWPHDALSEAELAELSALYTGDLGTRVIRAEITTRQAFSDPEIEAAARDAVDVARANGDARLGLIAEFMVVNDLVARNVSGALNANLAFLRGTADGGALALGEAEVLAMVSADVATLQAETEEWLMAFEYVAYAGLSDADLIQYTADTATPAGQALNAAVFVAVDTIIAELQYELGLATAALLMGEDI